MDSIDTSIIINAGQRQYGIDLNWTIQSQRDREKFYLWTKDTQQGCLFVL